MDENHNQSSNFLKIGAAKHLFRCILNGGRKCGPQTSGEHFLYDFIIKSLPLNVSLQPENDHLYSMMTRKEINFMFYPNLLGYKTRMGNFSQITRPIEYPNVKIFSRTCNKITVNHTAIFQTFHKEKNRLIWIHGDLEFLRIKESATNKRSAVFKVWISILSSIFLLSILTAATKNRRLTVSHILESSWLHIRCIFQKPNYKYSKIIRLSFLNLLWSSSVLFLSWYFLAYFNASCLVVKACNINSLEDLTNKDVMHLLFNNSIVNDHLKVNYPQIYEGIMLSSKHLIMKDGDADTMTYNFLNHDNAVLIENEFTIRFIASTINRNSKMEAKIDGRLHLSTKSYFTNLIGFFCHVEIRPILHLINQRIDWFVESGHIKRLRDINGHNNISKLFTSSDSSTIFTHKLKYRDLMPIFCICFFGLMISALVIAKDIIIICIQ